MGGKTPKTPKPPPIPPPVPMPDPEDIQVKTKSKKDAARKIAASGRESTMLSGNEDKLGG